jgi:2-methylisocitrate lyase-like PEP mutase family enzyme
MNYALQMQLWDKELDAFIKGQTQFTRDMETMYLVVIGQCTDAMRAKLESQAGFKALAKQSNTIKVLHMIRDISFNF